MDVSGIEWKTFYGGGWNLAGSEITSAGYKAISLVQTMALRLYTTPKNLFFCDKDIITGDGVALNKDGEALIALDAQPLQKIAEWQRSHSLYNWGLVLTKEQWEELKNQNGVLHLSQDKLKKSFGGYKLENNKAVPENELVGKIGQFLARDSDLEKYIQLE